jgi:hypothetical protein
MPPKMKNAAAPGRKPPRWIKTVEIIICRFSCFWYELPVMCVSTETFFQMTLFLYTLILSFLSVYLRILCHRKQFFPAGWDFLHPAHDSDRGGAMSQKDILAIRIKVP